MIVLWFGLPILISLFVLCGHVAYEKQFSWRWFFTFMLFLVLAASASAQGSYFSSNAWTASRAVSPGKSAPILTIPYAKVTVCANPATPAGAKCTNVVPVYSDGGQTHPIAQPLTADSQGNFGFYAQPGQYAYSLSSTSGTFLGTYYFTLGALGSTFNQLYADGYAGADIFAKIDAAFVSLGGTPSSPISSAVVNLSPGQTYNVTTPLPFPNAATHGYIYTPILDCHGSTVNYNGTDLEGLKVLTRNGGSTGSGEIRNCKLNFTTPKSHIRWESSTFFKWTNVSLQFNGVSRGVDMVNINSAAFGNTGGYFEENVMNFTQISAGSGSGACALTMRQDPTLSGGGSFYYNFAYGWHVDNDGTQGTTGGAICMESSPSTLIPGNNAFGWTISSMHMNGGGPIFQMGAGTFFTRATINITGEANAANASFATVHGPDSLVIATSGSMSATGGWPNSFLDGAHKDQVQVPYNIATAGGDAFPFPGWMPSGNEPNGANRNSKGFFLSNNDNTLALLSSINAACADNSSEATSFRIQRRITRALYSVLENNPIFPSDTQVTNLMDATGNACKGVDFGAGFHDQNTPAMYPSAAYDIAAHSFALVPNTARSLNVVHEEVTSDNGNGTLTHSVRGFDENEIHLSADGSQTAGGTQYTGACTYTAGSAITFHVVNGRITSCN